MSDDLCPTCGTPMVRGRLDPTMLGCPSDCGQDPVSDIDLGNVCVCGHPKGNHMELEYNCRLCDCQQYQEAP